MKKRVVVSFIVNDDNLEPQKLNKELRFLIGNTLKEKGFTHIVVFPGIDADTGQEMTVNFPPVLLDTSDYNNWDEDNE